MNELDIVELIRDKKQYEELGVKKGERGTILLGERNGYYLVGFHEEVFQNKNGDWDTNEVELAVPKEDLKVIHEFKNGKYVS